VRIVDPKRVRSFALSAGRLAKNDTIDAEMIAWFAETFDEAPSQTHDAAREELAALVKARKNLIDVKTRLQSQNEHAMPGPMQKAHAHVLKSLAAEIPKLEAAISARIKPHRRLPSAPRSSKACRASPIRHPRSSLQGHRSSAG
jgi:transposase